MGARYNRNLQNITLTIKQKNYGNKKTKEDHYHRSEPGGR